MQPRQTALSAADGPADWSAGILPHGSACSLPQISLVHYQSTYDVPYTATMALSLRPKVAEPPKRLAFATSGRVAGVTTTQTKYITCALGANGELCPQLQPAAPPAPTPDPPQPPMDVPTLIAKYLRRTKVMGQKGDIAVPYGVTQCLTGGKYLARIEHYAQVRGPARGRTPGRPHRRAQNTRLLLSQRKPTLGLLLRPLCRRPATAGCG